MKSSKKGSKRVRVTTPKAMRIRALDKTIRRARRRAAIIDKARNKVRYQK